MGKAFGFDEIVHLALVSPISEQKFRDGVRAIEDVAGQLGAFQWWTSLPRAGRAALSSRAARPPADGLSKEGSAG